MPVFDLKITCAFRQVNFTFCLAVQLLCANQIEAESLFYELESVSEYTGAIMESVEPSNSSDSDVGSFDAPGSPEYPLLSSGVPCSRCLLNFEAGNESSSRTPLSERQPHRKLSVSLFPARSKSPSQYSDDGELGEACISTRKKKKAAGRENLDGDDSLVTTNALLLSLIKRLDRQEKKLSKLEQKIDLRASPSSSSCTSTPRRATS